MSFEGRVPDDELEAMRRELAGLGQEPLPPAVAARLDARLAAELSATPLAARRSRPRYLRLGAASLSAAAALAAVAVFALSSGGGGHPAPEAAALRSSTGATTAATVTALTAAPTADSSAKTAVGAAKLAPKKCAPASQTGGGRPPAACPGARGGHARAV